MVRIIGNLFLVMILLNAAGCGSSGEGPIARKLPFPISGKTPPPQAIAVSPAPPSALPARTEPPYDPTGKPDPFQPPVLESSLEQTLRGKLMLPLEKFEVTEFQLVTTATGPGGNKAMVQDPSGKGYFLTVGSKIGKNQGRVVAIADRRILIEEKIKDFLGREKSRTVVLKIPQAP